MPARVQDWLPRVLAAGVVVVGVVLASRPWWQVVRQSATDPGARVVAGLQARHLDAVTDVGTFGPPFSPLPAMLVRREFSGLEN